MAPLIGIVTGMRAEAAALGAWRRDPRIAVAISGARPDRAEAEANRLVAAGARTLLSWGLAGGLAPHLVPGDLIAPGTVVLPDGTRIALAPSPSLPADPEIAIAGADSVVATPDAKAQLRARTGAAAVDMESHRLAIVARAAGIRLVVVRAISDPHDRALPALAASALGPDGRPRLGHVIAGLLRRPGDLGDLLAARRDSNAALAALAAAAGDVLAPLVRR